MLGLLGDHVGEVLALLAPLCWSFAVLLYRKTGEAVPPLALNLFKNVLVTPLFFASFLAAGAVAPETVGWRDLALLLASGAVGIGLADLLFFACLNDLGASRQAIVNTSYSPAIIFLSVVFLGERLTALQAAGVVLILTAVLTVGWPASGDRDAPRHLVRGVVLGLATSLAQAVSIVMIKPSMGEWPLLWMTAWRLAGGLAAMLIVWPLLPRRHRSLVALRDRAVWPWMLAATLLGSYVSLLLWMGGFKYADASIASALNQTATLFTFGLAVLLLGEPLTRRGVVGLALGVLGVAMVTFLGALV